MWAFHSNYKEDNFEQPTPTFSLKILVLCARHTEIINLLLHSQLQIAFGFLISKGAANNHDKIFA